MVVEGSDQGATTSASAGPAVLVVGAGPTGLLLAAELLRRGVACELIDERDAPMAWDRATVVHPASLEVFASFGLADRFLAAGTPQRGAKLHSGGQVLGSFEIAGSGSTFPYNVGMSEEMTESILTDHLHAMGGSVTRGTRLVELAPAPDGVVVTVERAGTRSSEVVRWVVGCDGLHSVTRTGAGIELEGHDIAAEWAVFDTTLTGWPERYDLTFVYLEPVPVILTALPGRRWRAYVRPSSGASDLVADATGTLTRYYPEVACADVERANRFHCHTRVARSFRAGAVLLAGDAAHLCSPSQGHGMNTGLQDAANLAWKLALVHHGVAPAGLLDSYEAERRPIAQAVGAAGDGFEHMETLTDGAARDERDAELRATFADATARQHEIVAEAEMDVAYVGSPIVLGDAGSGAAPGRRLPDEILDAAAVGAPRRLRDLIRHPGHTVLVLARADVPDDALVGLVGAVRAFADGSGLVDAVVVVAEGARRAGLSVEALDAGAAARLGVEATTLLVVRPDGYVGLRADDDHVAALERYQRLITGPTGPA